MPAWRGLSRRSVRALPHSEAQVSESSRFYAARGALLMPREVRRGVGDVVLIFCDAVAHEFIDLWLCVKCKR